jgi:hypothetical protein
MAKLSFDIHAFDLERGAHIDPAAAVDLLVHIANKFQQDDIRDALGWNVADYLLRAFESVDGKSGAEAARALTDAFFLTASHRRPKVDWITIGKKFENLVDDGYSETKASDWLAGEYHIDQRTAREHWKKYKEAKSGR